MGKLIYAEKITQSKEFAEKVVMINNVPYIKVADLKRLIDRLPSDFDVEKVLKQLDDFEAKWRSLA